ncbi:hypothetical protein HHI36_007517 [Cryptolaemus montrouzieri]|uniref:Glycogen debranching enzyme n=1 Tax=Cryptolaemus montrouzieri TaxID=559131 RepID=A0ABD2MPT8_9CUCU
MINMRNEQGDNSVVAEDSDSQASQSTEIVDPLKEGTSYCSSQSICQTSIKATSAKSLNVIEKVITGSGKQKQKGSSKLSLKTFVPPEATFSQRSKSDSSINTSKLQNQKKNKSEQVDLQSEEEPGPSFTLVKNKRNKKSSSEVPITEETSAENTDLKVVQPLFGESKKNNSPSIPEFSKSNESITAVPFKKCVQFEEVKESKKVDSNRTYAQVTSSLPSTHTETHFIESERSHQDQITSSPSLIHTERSFTETERSHQDQVTSSSSLTQTERNFETRNFHLAPNPGSWGKQYFDSSEETSGSPFAIVDIADVHREDTLTESENSESNILRTDPQLEGTLSDDLKAIEDLDQVTLSSSLIHKERNLNETENLQLSKNPVTWKKQYFDSSDETSGSPFVIVDIADVHTENTLTEFENSASNILRTDPQPEGTLSDDLKAIEDLDQVTLSSSLIHSERNLPETGNLQLLKDPVTQKKQYFESSEGTSGSPFAIVEEVQRENILTESENSENTDLQFDGTISDDSKGLTDLVDSEKEKTKEELVNKETTVECTDEFKSEDRELDQKQEILIPVKESNEEVDEQSKQDLEEENKENIEEDNNKEDLKEENIHNKQDSDEENNKQGSSNQTKEESQEEVLAKLWKLSPKFSEKHPSQIKTQLVEYQGGKSISFGTIVESDANSVKVQTELKSEAATSSPTSSKSTSDIQISWSSEEAHTRLYENNTAARLQAQLLEHQDTQNTYSDIPSDILDCDSIKIDESEVATLEKEISETESLQQLLEQPFSESESLKDYSLNIDIDELAGEGSLPVEVNSSEFREIEYSATREENQGLLTEQEVSEEIVSEEIQEEEKIIQGIPEVENESSVLKEQNTKSFQWSTEKFKQEADENCTSTHPIVNDLNKLNNIDIIDINHSDFKNMPVKNLKNICKNENEKTNHDTQVRVLTLGDLEFGESTLYRVEKNWVVQFRIGPTLFGRKISLYCNFPGEENGKCKDFDRNKYYLLEWKQDEGCENSDDTALYSQIVCSIAGSYHFYFTHNESTGDNMCGSGYFLVDPIIKYGNNENLPLDCIQCQTVISKQLGSFSTWEDKLKVSKESGYNMIHFTPIQELGASNSAYSLQDQLKLNTSFKKFNGKMPTLEELQTFIEKMRKEWKVTSICDIVLNHTANESPWLHEHPEATYNCQNCTYLRPAYLLDASLNQFSMDVKNGMYESKGIPSLVETEDHLNAIRYHLSEGVLRELKIQELLICDVNKYVSVFLNMARQNQPQNEAKVGVELKIIQDPEYRRLASSVDMDLAMQIYNIYRPDCFDEDARLRKCCEIFKQKLDSLNQEITNRLQDHLNKAVDNVVAGIRYWRVQGDGPKITEITIQNPLIFRYFTDYGTPKNIKECEEIMYSHNSRFLMAHNGWVMDSDPLVNFAGPQSDVYIRRELVAWGDSVKLRFGDKPSDSPFLWDHMRKYVELTARIFDGVRLDNCHSTPIKVAEYLLDCARKVRPDLYVVAELFTNSDATDNIFVNKLGISSLIREALNAWDSHEQGRLVYRFGGVPVGSFYQPNPRPLVPSIAHALFLDLTHDNKSPIETRSVFDLLPSSALVSMACCGVGSNRGYDELVPHQISVVDETREYTEWKVDNIDENPKYVSKETGIIAAKSALNDLHYKLGIQGFNQVYVDQMDPDVVAVTRHCPKTHQSYILVAFTAFKHPGENDYKWQRNIRPLRVEGILDEIVLEASLSHIGIR